MSYRCIKRLHCLLSVGCHHYKLSLQVYLNLASIPFAPRVCTMAIIAMITPTIAIFSSPVSVLGQPLETLYCVCAQLFAEACFYPCDAASSDPASSLATYSAVATAHPGSLHHSIERSNRRWFLRHEASGVVHTTVQLHPITLRLLSDKDEREYCSRQFISSYHPTLRALMILNSLSWINCYMNPALFFNSLCNQFVFALLYFLRRQLHQQSDSLRSSGSSVP